MDYFISLILYYLGIGLVMNTLMTLWIFYIASREGLSVRVDWIGWLKLIPTWPKQLYKLIEGISKRG